MAVVTTDSTVEILLEIDGSRKELTLIANRESVVFAIERELGKLGKDGVLASFSSSGKEGSSKKVYFLQRWAEEWNAFVDVTDVSQMANGDRLTVTRQQSSPKVASGFDTARGEVSEISHKIFLISLDSVHLTLTILS